MHLDHQTIGTGSDRSFRQIRHHPCVAAGVAGVYHHRQMGHLVQHDHTGKVQRVAHTGLKGADAALAQDDVLVALCHDVLGAHHELFQRVGKAALEQHRLFLAANSLEQLKVLHIAGTYLNQVYVFKQGQVLGVHDLGHDGRTGGAARQLEQVQTLAAHTLKGVGRGAGLECTAAQQGSACRLYPLGAVGDLLLALNAARPGDDRKVAAADLDTLHVDNAVVRVEFAVGFFVWLGHAAAGLHNRVCQHPALCNGLSVADQTQNMGVAALGIVDLQTHILQLVAELAHLYVGGILFEYDDHSILSPLPFSIL